MTSPMTYAELCAEVDKRAGMPVMTFATAYHSACDGKCRNDGYGEDCRGTGRIPLSEAEGAWALLEWLRETSEECKVTITLKQRKYPQVTCYIWMIDLDDTCIEAEGEGFTEREALFAAAEKMLEQEAPRGN